MSESIGMRISIGGTLPASLIEEFLSEIKDELSDLTGPTTKQELMAEAKGKSSIRWDAITNYGECDSLKSFLKKHNLGYIHHAEATCEYDAAVKYWVPGMKEEKEQASNQSGDQMIAVEKIRPICQLLLEYAKRGKDALPLFIGTEGIKDIVEKGLKDHKKVLPLLEKSIQRLFPGEPTLPPFIIKE